AAWREATDAHARAGHALEAVVALARRDGVPDLLEPQHRRVERDRAIHVGDGERDRAHGSHDRTARCVGDGPRAPHLLRPERRSGECQGQDRQPRELHRKRSRIWSPTRSALAMIVRAGFTAPLEGKKLPSTTYRLSSSCALQLRSSADAFGSSPKRIVPFWCATPASGTRPPTKRLPGNR